MELAEPDIRVIVGVDETPTTDRIRSDLNRIITGISNSGTFKIKIGVDTAQTSAQLQKQLNQAVQNVKVTTPTMTGATGAQSFTDTSMVDSYARKVDAVNVKINSLKQSTTSLNGVQAELNRSFQQLKGADTLEKQNAAAINLSAKLREAGQEYKNMVPAGDLGINKIRDIDTYMRNNTKSAQQFGEQLKNIQSKLANPNLTKGQYTQLNSEFVGITKQAHSMGLAGNTMGDSFANAFVKFSKWFGVTRIIMEIVQAIQKMVSIVTDLDNQMITLRMITGETEAGAAKMLSTYQQLATQLSSTTKEVAANAEVWLNL